MTSISKSYFFRYSFKNNKSPGQNRVTAELIKALDEDNKSHLLKLLNRCYRDKALFKEMTQADLAIIYKKGATDKPENYRPIALLNLSYKVLAKMIQVRLCNGLGDHPDSQQYGFRKARSTSQPFFTYKRNLEIHEEAGLEMYTLLLDWEKAFDKVAQERLIIVLKRMGIPDEMTDLFASIYKEPQFNVKDGKLKSSTKFQQTGIRPGCPLSPTYLFFYSRPS